jgi:hypothetical protein
MFGKYFKSRRGDWDLHIQRGIRRDRNTVQTENVVKPLFPQFSPQALEYAQQINSQDMSGEWIRIGIIEI